MYRSGTRLPPKSRAEVDAVNRVQGLVSGRFVNEKDELPPLKKTYRIVRKREETWQRPLRKDGTRKRGHFVREVHREPLTCDGRVKGRFSKRPADGEVVVYQGCDTIKHPPR